MSEKDPEYLVEKLDDEIDGYIRRVMVLDNFVLIEYSRRALFSRYVNPNALSDEVVEKNLLFDAVAPTVEEAVEQIKLKIKEYKNKKGV